MFPLDYWGRIGLRDPGVVDGERFIERILRRISSELAEIQKNVQILVENGEIKIWKPIFFYGVEGGWKTFSQGYWGLFGQIDKASIRAMVDNHTLIITYWVSFKGLFITVSGMILVMGIIMLSMRAPLEMTIGMVILGWLWLFGMNVVIFLLRFRAFLRRTVRKEIRWQDLR